MKKIFLFFTTMLALSLFSCGLVNVTNTPGYSDDITAPQITPETESGHTSISIAVIKGTEYINIFRYEVDSLGKIENETDPVNIGQIDIEEDYSKNSSSTVVFYDYYTYSNKNYQYKVRYKLKDLSKYLYSDNSKTCTGTGTSEGSILLSDSMLKIDDNSTILTISGSFSITPEPGTIEAVYQKEPSGRVIEEDDYTFLLAIKSSETIRLFELLKTDNGYTLAFRSVFPDDFYDNSLSVYGILAQFSDEQFYDREGTELQYTSYYWTDLYKGDLILHNSTGPVETFTVTKNGGVYDAGDYNPMASVSPRMAVAMKHEPVLVY